MKKNKFRRECQKLAISTLRLFSYGRLVLKNNNENQIISICNNIILTKDTRLTTSPNVNIKVLINDRLDIKILINDNVITVVEGDLSYKNIVSNRSIFFIASTFEEEIEKRIKFHNKEIERININYMKSNLNKIINKIKE